ncbi:MAG: hypothetical protein ABR509_00970 [Candidatus Limnocylindria bacterium]
MSTDPVPSRVSCPWRAMSVALAALIVACTSDASEQPSAPGRVPSPTAREATAGAVVDVPTEFRALGWFSMGSPLLGPDANANLVVGRLDGTVTARLAADYPDGLPGAGSGEIAGPESGIVLYTGAEGDEYVLRAIDVADGATSELLRTDATIHAATLDPRTSTVFYFVSDFGDGTGSAIWSMPVDGSEDPRLIFNPPAVARFDAILAAPLTFRATMAVSVEGDRLAVQECVRRCRILLLDIESGAVDDVPIVTGLYGLEGLAGDLAVGANGILDVDTGVLVQEMTEARLVFDADGDPVVAFDDRAGVAILDMATGDQLRVSIPPRVGTSRWRPVGAELPDGWVLALQALGVAPRATNQWVALRLSDGAIVPLPMLMPVPAA